MSTATRRVPEGPAAALLLLACGPGGRPSWMRTPGALWVVLVIENPLPDVGLVADDDDEEEEDAPPPAAEVGGRRRGSRPSEVRKSKCRGRERIRG